MNESITPIAAHYNPDTACVELLLSDNIPSYLHGTSDHSYID